MRDVTESELARMEAQDNTSEQTTLDIYLQDPETFEKEADLLEALLNYFHWHHAGMLFCAAMSRLHTKMGQQTGKMFTLEDRAVEGDS